MSRSAVRSQLRRVGSPKAYWGGMDAEQLCTSALETVTFAGLLNVVDPVATSRQDGPHVAKQISAEAAAH